MTNTLDYTTSRRAIKSGDVILWSGTGLAARIVRLITKSRWSHIGIAVWWGRRLMVLDAYPFKGVSARPLSNHLKNAWWLQSRCNWGFEALSVAVDAIEKRYSWQNIWKTWLGLNLVKREYQCAQYVAEVLSWADICLTQPATPESVAAELSTRRVKLDDEPMRII